MFTLKYLIIKHVSLMNLDFVTRCSQILKPVSLSVLKVFSLHLILTNSLTMFTVFEKADRENLGNAWVNFCLFQTNF